MWLFRGDLDQIVPAAVAESLADLYRFLGADVYVEPARTANHGIPVETFAGESRFPPRDCTEHALPFVIECGFDGAELLLRHLYREDFSEEPVGPHGAGSLQPFDQTQFVQASLSGVGYIYVPEACRSEECRLHVAFHGCRQNLDAIHDDFIRDAGYNRWAAANRIVIL